MAGKSRRIASRQSQLKRKKTTKGPSGIPNGRRVPAPVDDEPVVVPARVEEHEAMEAAAAPRQPHTSPVARTPRGEFAGQGQGRLSGERPAAYLFVGAEFRRIVVLASAMIAALIVLGIVL